MARMTVSMFSRRALAPILAILLSACGANDNDPGPGGVTVGEARALDEAAAMLDDRRAKTFAAQQTAAAAEQNAAAQDPSPAADKAKTADR